jgi:hypothetical protein
MQGNKQGIEKNAGRYGDDRRASAQQLDGYADESRAWRRPFASEAPGTCGTHCGRPDLEDAAEDDMLSRVATLIFVALAAAVGQFSLLRAEESTRLTDLTIAEAERTVIEGRNGIKITFDGPSAERLRQFTRDLVGRRIVVLVNQRRLATALLLPPIVNGNTLVAGDLDSLASEALFSAGGVLTLEIERPEPSK